MSQVFPLQFYASGKVIFQGDCSSLIIPVADGMYGFQASHANTIASIVPGSLKLTDDKGQVFYYAVSEGMLKFEEGRAIVLVSTGERADEIDIKLAEQAAREAEEELRQKRDGQSVELAQRKLIRELNRIKVKEYYS